MQTTAPQLREMAQRALLRMGVLIDHADALEANAPISGRFKVADVPFIRARAARLQKGYRRLIEAAAVRDGQGSVVARLVIDPADIMRPVRLETRGGHLLGTFANQALCISYVEAVKPQGRVIVPDYAIAKVADRCNRANR